MLVPRGVKIILANGKGLPTNNPFHIYYKWGKAYVEIKPYGDMSGYPFPKVYIKIRVDGRKINKRII